MNLSPAEANRRINDRVTVEMVVQRTKYCSGSRRVFLDSETNYRDPANFGVVITKAGVAQFAEAGIADLTAHFGGKVIRVSGIVIRKDDRPCIEVDEPSQIELAGSVSP